jgi:hypothetical protein
MQTADSTRRPSSFPRAAAAAALAAVLFPAPALAGGKVKVYDLPQGDVKVSKKLPGPVVVHFVDDSTMKVTFLDERIELETPHGKLLIPVTDIHHIEFASRTPEDAAKRVTAAVADLGHKDFKRRQAATDELASLGEHAYAALVEAVKAPELETARRAKELMDRITQTVPADRLTVRPHDVVHTATSKYTGRINVAALKVKTFQFGEQPLRLCDVSVLHFQGNLPPHMAAYPPTVGTSSLGGRAVPPTVNVPPPPLPAPR